MLISVDLCEQPTYLPSDHQARYRRHNSLLASMHQVFLQWWMGDDMKRLLLVLLPSQEADV